MATLNLKLNINLNKDHCKMVFFLKVKFLPDRGKTGYTKASKRVLVNFASKDGLDVVIVTINDSNDWQNHKCYLDNALSLKLKLVLRKGTYYIEESEYKMEIEKDIYVYANNISYVIDFKRKILYLYDDTLKIKSIKIELSK